MQGKTVIISGAGSGIGLETADALASRGARLILVDVNSNRGRSAMDRIARHGFPAHLILGDLSRQSEVRRIGGEILEWASRVDVLINNVGAIFITREVTEDGFERTFALNYLSHFLLTHLLLNRIVANAPARIINVSSGAHFLARLDFNDLQCEEKYSALDAYNRSKLAVILFTRALARRLRAARVTVNCLDPGMAATHIHDSIGGPVREKIERAKTQFGATAAEAAETAIHLASSSEVEAVSGEYFVNCGIAQPSTAACDDASAEQLWVVSRSLTGSDRDREVCFLGANG